MFNSDDTFCRIIDFKEPRQLCGISFDTSGHLHVTSYNSNTVTVLTPEGQYIRQYGQCYFNERCGTAIDLTGNSFVVNYKANSFCIFDSHGNYIHSTGGFKNPIGVAVASNGPV